MNEEFSLTALPDISTPPSSPLAQRYQNARVTVYYLSGVTDTGWISHIETHWIELVKDTNERLLIPMSALRLIKLLEAPKQHKGSETLLRPSGPQQIET